MKTYAVSFAMCALLTTVAASAAGSPVTLVASSVSFKQGLAACPGALGSVSFTLGHVRIAAAKDVATQTDTNGGVDTVTFSNDGGQSATIVADGRARTVSGTNVVAKSKNQVACVMP